MSGAYSAGELVRILSGETLAATGGPGAAGGPAACIDSRLLREGEIFFALAGERTDGHRFLEGAFREGASLAVVRKDRIGELPGGLPLQRIIAVDDPAGALLALARHHRRRYDPLLIAVTGSNGKTTTKDLLAAIFAAHGPTLATKGNYNTFCGVALTLLGLGPEHRFAVIELGISAPGEMDVLGALAAPGGAVFTNAHGAHLEGLGTVEKVADEKTVLIDHVAPGGRIWVNGDDAALMNAARRRGAPFRTYGLGGSNEIRPARRDPWNLRGVEVEIEGAGSFRASLWGEHHLANLVAALAVALGEGVPPDVIARGLATFEPAPGRFRPERVGGVLLVDDTYNANLASTLGAVRFLEKAAIEGRRALLFGDMLELGPREEEDHRAVGRAVAEAMLDRLWLAGERTRWTAEEAVSRGLPRDRIFTAGADRTGLGGRIAGDLAPGDCLVEKGSRGMKMEEILDDVRSRLAGAPTGGGV
ncbi:MAG: UDP-N-acetylmuramoyl-tripeptide--D-alanyl-D-alanine ligase [Candidatus Eisenbacteria bacterium]